MIVLHGATTQISGRYKLKKCKKTKTGKEYDIVETGWFDNLITNTGLNSFLGANNPIQSVVVGSGNSTPLITNTALDTLVADSGSIGIVNYGIYEYSTGLWCLYANYYKQFDEGEAAGNLQEVGIYDSNDALTSRALILDSGGSPTSLTIASNEFLTVYYSLRKYPKLTKTTGNVTFTGSKGGSYDYEVLPYINSNCTAYGSSSSLDVNSFRCFSRPAVLGDFLSDFSGADQYWYGASYCVQSVLSYISGSYYRDFRCFFEIADCNDTSHGIQGFRLFIGRCYWKFIFDPYIPKRDTDELTIIVRTSVARTP